MSKKQSPLEAVAAHLAECRAMDFDRYYERIEGVLDMLHDRAKEAIESGKPTPECVKLCEEYLAAAELVAAFGATLIAHEDIDRSAN